ncbi:G-protein coupled receptor 54-like [Strongylocentrotus purpuratus]|uniref:G-protein coupled receptors family 1 profile domain-containing protein n=1 Tax=Strongylocentrotus purpuratus TaxID=7668 RepID=A0A7M7P432_STRPU|nr:G-protein coupled receptor 54-like [Strongylocentrotus purpuratus]
MWDHNQSIESSTHTSLTMASTDKNTSIAPMITAFTSGNQLSVENWLVPAIFFLITLIGVVGNFLVIYVIIRHGQMKTVTNYYIVNLAITDVSFLLCCAPFTAIVYAIPTWIFGRFMCKFVFFMMQVTAQATCLTLTAMSVDRYKAIVRPLQSLKTRTTRAAVIINVCIWAGSACAAVPTAIYFDVAQFGDALVCIDIWPRPEILYPGYAIYGMVALYLVPLTIICVCYSIMLRKLWQRVSPGEQTNNAQALMALQQKRKITRMIMVVVLLFALCWLPLYIFTTWFRLDRNFPKNNGTYFFKVFAHMLSYANSCVNPFVYAFLGENFRRYFKKAFPLCFKKKDGSGNSTRTEPIPTAHQRVADGERTQNNRSVIVR